MFNHTQVAPAQVGETSARIGQESTHMGEAQTGPPSSDFFHGGSHSTTTTHGAPTSYPVWMDMSYEWKGIDFDFVISNSNRNSSSNSDRIIVTLVLQKTPLVQKITCDMTTQIIVDMAKNIRLKCRHPNQ